MIVYLLAAYLTGTFLTAYWIGKWKGVDLREHRGGNLGARNAGATIGKWAFFLTFAGDAGKASLIVLIGQELGFPPAVVAAGGLAVMLGHIYPFYIKGGGKGIASFIGAALFAAPMLSGVAGIFFVLALVIIRSATLSMPIGFLSFIGASFFLDVHMDVWPLFFAVLLILIRHRKDMAVSIRSRFPSLSSYRKHDNETGA